MKALFKLFMQSPWEDYESQDENINSFTKKKNNHFGNFDFFSFDMKVLFIIFAILFGLWIVSGFYQIKEGEQGVVTRFGKFIKIQNSGLNYHMPYPIENVFIEKVNQSRRIEIGYRSVSSYTKSVNYRDIPRESIMLTGDENIVAINADVMWHINDLKKYVFNVLFPEDTVKSVAESAIREVIGNTPINSALSSQKQEISSRIEHLLQEILDSYGIGVGIEQVQLLKVEPPAEVIDSYRDVQTARADKEKSINQAKAYSNDIIPRARGEAEQIVKKAEGYRAEVIARAQGDTSRFNNIYKEYLVNKKITKYRLYLNSIEKILSNADNKFIIGKDSVLPHLPIDYQ